MTQSGDWMLVVDCALSHGRVGDVKTIERTKRVPTVVYGWLRDWRQVAEAHGLPADETDFIVPGAAPDGHVSLSQRKKWGARYFRSAAKTVAERHPHLSYLQRATPYAARRGHITSRILAGEPVDEIARSCGTSPETIHRHYYVAIDSAVAGHRLPPFDNQLAAAAALVDG